MSLEKAVLLLGRRDEPVDGVADYCERLHETGDRRGFTFEIFSVAWAQKGWSAALAELHKAALDWRGRWVFLQYTTLAWSRRGFPLHAPHVLDVLRQCGARPGVVFHDFMPLPGSGVVGSLREYCHQRVLRQLHARSDLAVFTVPVAAITWLDPPHFKAVFIPVGSNFPELGRKIESNDASPPVFTVAVFGITGGEVGRQEVSDIAYALRGAQSKGLRVRLFAIGRGCEVFEEELQMALNGSGIGLSMLGLMSAQELVQSLASADVQLCVRGLVSSRRGSAIAGIVCGLPIVGYRGSETGFPVTEAGVKLVESRDREELRQALWQVLSDENLLREMRRRSAAAARNYFSWDAITTQFITAMSER